MKGIRFSPASQPAHVNRSVPSGADSQSRPRNPPNRRPSPVSYRMPSRPEVTFTAPLAKDESNPRFERAFSSCLISLSPATGGFKATLPLRNLFSNRPRPEPVALKIISGKGGTLAKFILIEEFHLTIAAAPNQPQHIYDAIAHALGNPRLHAALRRAIRDLFQRDPALRAARLRLTR